MYTLYNGAHSRGHMTAMVMAELDVPFNMVLVDVKKGEQNSSEYRAINPTGWVPTLVTPDGEAIYETPAIHLCLIERHDKGLLAPAPTEPQRAQFLSSYCFITGELEPTLKRYFYAQRYVVRPEETETIRKQALATTRDNLKIIDNQLAKAGPYHLGSRFSILDLTLCYWMRSIMHQAAVADFPAINDCVDLVQARPKLTERFKALDAIRIEYTLARWPDNVLP